MSGFLIGLGVFAIMFSLGFGLIGVLPPRKPKDAELVAFGLIGSFFGICLILATLIGRAV